MDFVFFMLTSSHRGTNKFYYSMKSLTQNTDLSVFNKKYLLCHNITVEHANIVSYFAAKYDFEVLLCQGDIMPCLTLNQNLVMAKHPGALFVKCDDDLFFMPQWLPNLLATYERNKNHCGLVSSFVPINQASFDMMLTFFQANYANEFAFQNRPPLLCDEELHYWLWDKILNDRLVERYQNATDSADDHMLDKSSYLHINCVIYTPKLIETFHQFPTSYVLQESGGYYTDEQILNYLCKKNNLNIIISRNSLVHHHGFHRISNAFYEKHTAKSIWSILNKQESHGHI